MIVNESGEDVCRKCGQCCFYKKNGILKRCKYLIQISKDWTYCRVYKNRVGIIIDDGFMCKLRKDSDYDYPDCPYNTNKKMFEE